ncbi:MAG: response regulator [Anaerolineae bacterium]|nr:response regulator [Anaerolineae bacterium]
MRTVLALTLQRTGWQIVEAEDGLQALQLTAELQPHMILLDYNMPNMDGIEACYQLKNHPQLRHIPVIIYTGAYASDVRKLAQQAGADHFLTKPILPADLRQIVEKLYQERFAQS